MDVPQINPRGAEPPDRRLAAGTDRGRRVPARRRPLPSEKNLVDMFGVARDTARRAVLQALREADLVVTIPQRGTYVLPAPPKGDRGT